ncbi:MAG: S8 family serine peptidase [Candidatus Latescibacteria bacterium]|nr:S8 family serine peptidase [bacterium]MBD3424326.1 S8 family serine peptidase [Candidatus Latescibacterota bacterium]
MKRFIAFITLIIIFLYSSAADSSSSRLNSSLRLLREINNGSALKGQKERLVRSGVDADRAFITVKFDHVLSRSEIEELRGSGAVFYYLDGEVARTGSIYPVTIPYSGIDGLAADRRVVRMESTFKPAIYPLLDVSSPEIQADQTWTETGPSGNYLTGKGLRIADFDTGIDVFHPAFFKADGDTLNWLDLNGNEAFDNGVDAVDKNNNGTAESDERLCYFDGEIEDYAGVFGPSNPNNSGNGYQPYWDWLYNDINQNSIREYGPGSGYGDADPTFGEPLYVVWDKDSNQVLNVSDQLIALGTSKIYATMNADSVERIRGVDLTLSDPDDYGHGTGVCGILAGGWTGVSSRFTGIAPEAEILAGNYFSNVDLSYLIPWARSRGADVMLYEFGGFVFSFLDGSSLNEQLVTAESDTIMQVVPSGNLGRGGKHAIADVAASDTVILNVKVSTYGSQDPSNIYWSTLWRTSLSDLSFELESPAGGSITITGGNQYVDGYYIWSSEDQSSRGTCKLDIYVDENSNPDVLGDWFLTVDNSSGSAIEVISNVADNLSSWSGGAQFDNYRSNDRNVTYPATADSAFVNGSYSTRGFESYYGTGGGSINPGEISAFSGRGERIDGKHLLDICSPGNYDVFSTKSHTDADSYPLGGFLQFSGTSAAGPHVAAAAALVQQKWPDADLNEIAYLLTSHAETDSYTGAVYNDTWGYGKLRLMGAVGVPTAVDQMAAGEIPPALTLGQNYPNPFNPTTWIPFYLPEPGSIDIRVYDVTGRMVKSLEKGFFTAGRHNTRWDGINSDGSPVASGIYFCVISHGGATESRKMVLLR